MIVLGVDVGTTHTKVLALDTERGDTVALASAPTPVSRSSEGASRRADDVLDTVIALVAAAVADVDDPGAIAALCVASVGEEVVLLGPAGDPVGDTIAWYDVRGSEQAAVFLAGAGGTTALSRRWPPDPSFSLFKLLWTRDHRPDELAAAATWTDLGDWVLAGLGAETVVDWSHASRAGAFDLSTRAWDDQTIEAAGLDLRFPRPVPSGSVIGVIRADIARRSGLPLDVALVSGGHDHLCAAFGAGVRTTAELFLSAGTSEAHLALSPVPLDGEAARSVDQGCFVDADSYYLHVNIHSGHFFQGWRDLLYRDVDDETMYAEVAAVTAGAAGVRFELADGLRAGRLDRVPYDADRATVMRAVLEGLAARSAAIVAQLEQVSGNHFALILAAGHPTRVPLWRELRRAAYGRPMAAVDATEPTAYGAAVLAASAVAAPGADRLMARRVPWESGSTSRRRSG